MEPDFGIVLVTTIIFVLRVATAAFAAVRILVMARGSERWAGAIGFFEALVYVISFGLVVTDLTNVPAVLAYCLGFSVGTVVGMRLEKRLALGVVTLRVISRHHAIGIAEALRAAGAGATLSWGEGRDGSVGIVQSVVTRRLAGEVQAVARGVDPDAFIVADESRAVVHGWFPGAVARSLREHR